MSQGMISEPYLEVENYFQTILTRIDSSVDPILLGSNKRHFEYRHPDDDFQQIVTLAKTLDREGLIVWKIWHKEMLLCSASGLNGSSAKILRLLLALDDNVNVTATGTGENVLHTGLRSMERR